MSPIAAQDRNPASTEKWDFNRRSVLAVGGSLAALGVLGHAWLPDQHPVKSRFRYVITDRRHGESLVFGHALARNGSAPLDVAEGLTRMWRETLLPFWKQAGGSIAGLTSIDVFACLREQARSERRRSTLIGRHLIEDSAASVGHIITAPRTAIAGAALDEIHPARWPAVMAQLVGDCPTNPICDAGWQGGAALPAKAQVRSLASWIIE